jgi:hypothetical protein
MIHKKKIAAIAAVTRYIQAEQEQAPTQVFASKPIESPALPISEAPQQAFNLWGGGGRAQQMQMRTLMQMKSFYRK